MRNKLIWQILLLFGGIGLTMPAYAYLDPGSGSILLQGLLAGSAGVVAILKLYWQRIKQSVHSLVEKIKSKKVSADPLIPPQKSVTDD